MTNQYMLEVVKRGHVYIFASSIEEAREKFNKDPDQINIEWEEEITDEKPYLTGQEEEI